MKMLQFDMWIQRLAKERVLKELKYSIVSSRYCDEKVNEFMEYLSANWTYEQSM